MLMGARDEETGKGMTDTQLRDEVMTIFIAGHETGALALGPFRPGSVWRWVGGPESESQGRCRGRGISDPQLASILETVLRLCVPG